MNLFQFKYLNEYKKKKACILTRITIYRGLNILNTIVHRNRISI